MDYEVHGEAIHVTFPQQELVFIGDRWKEVGGDLTAEVTVRTTVAGLPPHVHQARLRLNSTAGAETFAKYCAKRWQGLDWREWLDMVEDVRLVFQEVRRRGAPVVDLGDGEVSAPARHLVEGLVPADGVTVMYGDGGTGKSTLLLYCDCCLTFGIPFLGRRTVKSTPIYVDFETTETTQRRRLERLAKGMEWGVRPNLRYFRATAPVVEMGPDLRRLCEEQGADVVLLDSLGYAGAASTAQGASDITLAAFRALQALARPVITVAHVSKDVKGDDKPFGSVFTWNSARSAIQVRKEQEEGEDDITVGLFHRKANDMRRSRPIGVRIRFGEETTIIRPADLRDSPALSKGLALGDRVMGLLRDGAKTTEELLAVTGAKEASMRQALKRLRDRGRLVKVADGLWGASA